MPESIRLAIRPVTEKAAREHLAAMGLKPSTATRGAVVQVTLMGGGVLWVDDNSGGFPHRALARRLAAESGAPVEVVRAESETTETEEEGVRLDGVWERWTAQPDQSWQRDRRGEDMWYPDEEWGEDQARMTHYHAGQLVGAAFDVSADGESKWTGTFRLPARPADPWLDERPSPGAAAVWSSATGEAPVSPELGPYLAWRLEALSRLDRDTAAPDLGRWRERLTRRHGSDTSPAFYEDWERLTRTDRIKRSPRDGCVAAWKLLRGDALLDPQEAGWIGEALAQLPAGHTEPASLAPALQALRRVLGGGEVTIR